jgi:pimeloyl-ACP methyl ester carboxylesterase
LINSSSDPRLLAAYKRQREAFRKAAILLVDSPVEVISIPYENTTLPGYFLKVDNSDIPRPTLIITGGYDSPAEELYFFSGAAAITRGYNCIIYDGPGQGGALIEQGLVFRPDWENVVTPVVDYLLTRKEVEQKRIALMGISFGGYLAPRAATSEHRISALIADPAQHDLFEAIQSRMPGFLLKAIISDNSFQNWLANMIIHPLLKKPTKGWSLRRGMYVHGVNSVKEYILTGKQYSFKAGIHQIQCPTLVCAAENDEIASLADKVYDLLSCPKTFLKFTDYEGAGVHCEDGNRSLFNQRAFDWLDDLYAK